MTIDIFSKKRSAGFLKGLNIDEIKVGIIADDNDLIKLGLKNVGESVVPSPSFGKVCGKNANGFEYVDKTKKREQRYVCTVWIYPYGNRNADRIPVDIYRKCFPKVFVAPLEIEMLLEANDNGELFIIASFGSHIDDNAIVDAINMFVEIFGRCTIFTSQLTNNPTKKIRLNWELLPPSEKPSSYAKRILEDNGETTDTFDIARLKYMDKFKAKVVGVGTNGFSGYYAYVLEKICVFESAKYGNATYIVPNDDWTLLSQMTKKELFDNEFVLAKIIHNADWKQNVRKA